MHCIAHMIHLHYCEFNLTSISKAYLMETRAAHRYNEETCNKFIGRRRKQGECKEETRDIAAKKEDIVASHIAFTE